MKQSLLKKKQILKQKKNEFRKRIGNFQARKTKKSE